MPTRHKFELLLGDLFRLLADTTGAERYGNLSLALWNLAEFTEELTREPAKLGQLLEFAQALRGSAGPGRQIAEERLMGHLSFLAGECVERLDRAGFQRVPGFPPTPEVAPRWQATWLVLRALHDFALTCFDFCRPRDAFAGHRRGLAFDVLAQVGRLVDLPDVLLRARQALRKARSVEARQAATFLEEYLQARHRSPDDDTVSELLSLAKKAASGSTAFQALNALVEIGVGPIGGASTRIQGETLIEPIGRQRPGVRSGSWEPVRTGIPEKLPALADETAARGNISLTRWTILA